MKTILLISALLLSGCTTPKIVDVDVGSIVRYQDKTYVLIGITDDEIEYQEIEL